MELDDMRGIGWDGIEWNERDGMGLNGIRCVVMCRNRICRDGIG
jgi:hypothetical protein